MGMTDFGVTFNPAASMDQKATGGSSDPNANVQEAIRTLSLRLPSVVGAKSIAPMSLLTGAGSQGLPPMGAPGQPGAMGQPGQAPMGLSLQQILQMLMGGKAPTPNVIPGVNPGEPSPGTFNPIGTEDPAPIASVPPGRPMPSKPMGDSRMNEDPNAFLR